MSKISDEQEISQEERELKIEYLIFVPVLIIIVLLISFAIPKNNNAKAVELVPASGASGHWMVYENGKVESQGVADEVDDINLGDNVYIVDAAKAEQGFWVLTNKGNVYPVAGAEYAGGLDSVYSQNEAKLILAQPNQRSYRIVTVDGEVYDFNATPVAGDKNVSDKKQNGEQNDIVAAVSTSSGEGYWLLARNGSVYSFGDAPELQKLYLRSEYVIDAVASMCCEGFDVLTNRGRLITVSKEYGQTDALDSEINTPLVDLDSFEGDLYKVTDQAGVTAEHTYSN